MRKILIPVLMMLMLVGCGQPESVEIPNSTQSVTAQTQQETGIRNPVLVPIEEGEETGAIDAVPTESEEVASRPVATAPEKEHTHTGSPTEPQKPEPTTPKPTEPVQSDTVTPKPPVDETVPSVTEPDQTNPTQPTPTEPTPAEPVPTEPAPTEPAPTDPESEVIDTAALEAYARSYASSAYGYNGTSACGPGSGAGYFPGATKEILTMADGYNLVCQAIDAQYARDIASGYAPYEDIDGVTVRCPINVRVEQTGQANMYIIWVYYGGA